MILNNANGSKSNSTESIKIITRKASERIAKFAFDYAVNNKNLAHDSVYWALNNR